MPLPSEGAMGCVWRGVWGCVRERGGAAWALGLGSLPWAMVVSRGRGHMGEGHIATELIWMVQSTAALVMLCMGLSLACSHCGPAGTHSSAQVGAVQFSPPSPPPSGQLLLLLKPLPLPGRWLGAEAGALCAGAGDTWLKMPVQSSMVGQE